MEPLRGFVCDEPISSSTEDETDVFSQQTVAENRNRHNGTTRGKCASRNALMARENRRRKKVYLESIESELKFLREENRLLKIENKKNRKEINSLNKEIIYLKSILSNSSGIEKLLSGINKALKPNVIVAEQPQTIQYREGNLGPLLGDPMFSSSSDVGNALGTPLQTEGNQRHELEDMNEDLPQSHEKKNLGRLAGHLPMDLQDDPER